MRRLVFVFLLVIVTMSILWVFAGQKISSFVDRFTIQTIAVEEGLSYIRYEGTGDGGVLFIHGLALSLAPLNPHVGSTKDNRLAIASGGKTFAFAPVRFLTDNRLEANVTDNETHFRVERSYLPWPSFERMPARLNRHEYYEYICTARTGQRLRMLWSVNEQKNATSLIRIDISTAAR